MTETAFDRLYQDAVTYSAHQDVRESTSDEIDDLWTEVHTGVDPTEPSMFGTFLARFIAQRYRETPPTERKRRLCGTGNHMCNCLSGDVPAALQSQRGRFGGDSSLTPEVARTYVERHPQCHAVRDGLEAWSAGKSKTKERLRRIIALARQDISASEAANINAENVPTGAD